MYRRRLCALIGGLAAWPVAAVAQPAGRRLRIAFLGGSAGPPDLGVVRYQVEPFRQGLRELGYVEGPGLTIDWRWAEGQPDRLPGLLAELIASQPDVLVTAGPRPAQLARDATSTLPIVAVAVDDPVAAGLAATHARPGRNITGLSGAYSGVLSRRLQLLKDLLPAARRFAVLMNPATLRRADLDGVQANAAQTLGVHLTVHEARGPDDFDAAFAAMVREKCEAVAVLADATFYVHRLRLGDLCRRHRLPSIWGGRGYLEGGGLLSFQGDWAALHRRAADLVDKILRGARPGDLPFEQSSKFELVLNLKAARELGLDLPQSLLVSADEVIP